MEPAAAAPGAGAVSDVPGADGAEGCGAFALGVPAGGALVRGAAGCGVPGWGLLDSGIVSSGLLGDGDGVESVPPEPETSAEIVGLGVDEEPSRLPSTSSRPTVSEPWDSEC